MNFRRIVMIMILIIQALSVTAQEYYRPVSIKKDSVYDGSVRLLGRLQQSGTSRSNEAARNYRDSLMRILVKTDSNFRDAQAISTVPLPHPAFRLMSDIAWNDFKISANKDEALQQLKRLALSYPVEQYIHGNLALAYEMIGRTDSAAAVIDRFLTTNPAGFTSLHLQKNIISYKWKQIGLPEIVNLRTDSFKTWINDADHKLPADLDSLRNALAITIIHRTESNDNDSLLAQLVLDYADVTAKDKSYLLAVPFYKEAVRYNPSLQSVVDARQETIGEIDASIADTFKWASVIYAVPLLALVFILIIWIKNRNRNPDDGDSRVN